VRVTVPLVELPPELELLVVPLELPELELLWPPLELLWTPLELPELELPVVPLELLVVPLELLVVPLELLVVPLELLVVPLELPVVPLELPVPPPELERPEFTGLPLRTSMVAEAGLPNSAEPSMLVSEIAKDLPLALLATGTTTVLALVSPSCQVTLPLVAV
jgi:hypothetical protein